MKRVWMAALLCVVLGAGIAGAAPVTISPKSDWAGAVGPSFGPLAQAVGTYYVPQGVDFSFGNVEGVFSDPPLAFCGINGSGICDLVTAVDAAIVGVADSVFAEAGYAGDRALLLEVFDGGANLLASAPLTLPTGPNGRFTATINRAGLWDIAYFRISGGDTFGVDTITIDARQVVPEPGTLLLMGTALALAGARRRNR